MSAKPHIIVQERGFTDIDKALWSGLVDDENFTKLLDSGVLSVSVQSKEIYRLHGSCYVGRAECNKATIELKEKVPGALQALLEHTTHEAFRIEKVPAPASQLGDTIALLINQFLNAVAVYVAAGRNFGYVSEQRVGSLAGGKLNIVKTIQLRARGLGHQLAFQKSVVNHRTPENRIIFAALREIEYIASVVNVPWQDLSRARGLAMLFSDCRDYELLFGRKEKLVQQSQSILDQPMSSKLRDIVSLASIILANESFEFDEVAGSSVPRAWYLNLENLFELAVRRVMVRVGSGQIEVKKGGDATVPIFDTESQEFRANPDLVIRTTGVVSGVGDVKYKNWSGSAKASDIYQLLVHAAAFGGSIAFLVFPHDKYELRHLGVSATGCATWLAGIDVRNLDEDIRQLLTNIALIVDKSIAA